MTIVNFHGYFKTDKTINELNQLSDFEMYKLFNFVLSQGNAELQIDMIYEDAGNTIYEWHEI